MKAHPPSGMSCPLARTLVQLCCALPAAATDLSGLLADAWAVAEQRSAATVAWMETSWGEPGMYTRYPNIGNLSSGRWSVAANTRDWRNGFWPGTLWMLAQKTGDPVWQQRATDWSAALAASDNTDHDIGFILLGSMGKGWYFHDDLSDPGGAYREFARHAITVAAAKLDARYNKPNAGGIPVPAGFIRSWDTIEAPYPVCIDNLMNLELLMMAYELNGRPPEQRAWFDHALAHARGSIARHLRADGGSYHVVKHFEDGAKIGQIERKSTRQGYGDETTWARGQAWAIYGLTAVYRHASRDPGTDASDIRAAAEAVADYFLDHLPHRFTADPYNHRPGDHVPANDFDAALGEPAGPWNDADNNYNSSSGSGLGDRKPATHAFTPRDSSAAAIAAAGLAELAGYAPEPADRTRYLGAAEEILTCLISYDGPDAGGAADYRCAADETTQPGILKQGCVQWNDPVRSLIYGDYYFLEAVSRLEAREARQMLAATRVLRRCEHAVELDFEVREPAPPLAFRVEHSADLGTWTTIAAKTGSGSWTGDATVIESPLAVNRTRVTIPIGSPGNRGFLRIVTRALDGIAP